MSGWIDLDLAAHTSARVSVKFANRNGRRVLTDLRISDDAGLDTTKLRAIPLGRVESMLNLPDFGANANTSRREPLPRPDGTDPQTFYRQVADAYNAVVLQTSTPAKVLAEQSGVPVGTVHRWIREARIRGFLPPARKGRAG